MSPSLVVPLSLLAFTQPEASLGTPIAEHAPWARAPDDDLGRTLLERVTGRDESELPDVEPLWIGNKLYGRDSFAKSIMDELGIAEEPLAGMSYDPSPGVLLVVMGGITLSPTCNGGDQANAAKNCSGLVQKETQFPPFGSASQQQALFQKLQQYYEPFNVVLTVSRPPEWLPYTMAVVGGSASNAGFSGGVCGVANVACDGLKRNHVSLTFPSSCSGSAETAAQETAHNWGLEHTDNTSDLLYPLSMPGAQSFVDDCMDISHATGDGITQCGYVHRVYCAAGDGEQQNTYRELLGVFGPRQADDVAPVITEIWPEDGAVFGESEIWNIGAKIDDNSNFIGVKWSWVEGLPEGMESYTRCTNNVCDKDYNPGPSFDPAAISWDFVNINGAPAGTYKFKLETVDAYANFAQRTITVTVVPDAAATAGGEGDPPGEDSGGTSAADDAGLGTTGEAGGTGDGVGADDSAGDDHAIDSKMSSGCRVTPSRSMSLVMLLALLGAVAPRRRRSA